MKLTWGGKKISCLEIVVFVVLIVGMVGVCWKLLTLIEDERDGFQHTVIECPADSISKLCKGGK